MPVYVHLGRLWTEENGRTIDPDRVIADALPLLDPGDILAHPFTKHPGAFVSREGTVHPLIFDAIAHGVRIDVGRGGHMSFDAARIALDAGVTPFTVGGDVHDVPDDAARQRGTRDRTWTESGDGSTGLPHLSS